MKVQRITVLVAATHKYERDVFRGIIRYAFPGRRWLLVEANNTWVYEQFDIRGALTHLTRPRDLDLLRLQKFPIVDTANILAAAADLPRVGPDDRAIGAMAAAYFLERRYEHFVFAVQWDTAYSDAREQAFTEASRRPGTASTAFTSPRPWH
jgi:DNA-binding LacI/PurR family transcriptional regulator